MQNKEIILGLLQDMQDFAKMKNIQCEPIYLLGGSGCILMNYLNRGTTDIDFIDLDYSANMGRLFRILESFDMLDWTVASIPSGYKERATKLVEFDYIDVYVLSMEDIIVSKIGRYSEKDVEDIAIMMDKAKRTIVFELIENVLRRSDFSEISKSHFEYNAKIFKEKYYV